MVGDGDAMGITGQVLEDMVWPTEGWFGIDDPILLKQRSQESAEILFIRQWQTLTEEGELSGAESASQSGAELTAEHPAQHFHR